MNFMFNWIEREDTLKDYFIGISMLGFGIILEIYRELLHIL